MEINVGDFVLVHGIWYVVLDDVDHNGYFLSSDNDGDDYCWHIEQVESVDSLDSQVDNDIEIFETLDDEYEDICPFD